MRGFDHYAKGYAYWQAVCAEKRYVKILEALGDNSGTVLDLGCGAGALVRILAGRHTFAVGLDISEVMIRLAREGGPVMPKRLHYVVGDILQPPFARASFGAVVSYGVMHHFPVQFAMEKVKELLRPGGRLVIMDFVAEDNMANKSTWWHVRRAVGMFATYVQDYGALPALRVVAFRLTPAWLRHVTGDPLMARETFIRTYGAALPGSEFCRFGSLLRVAWTAPGNAAEPP